MEKNINGYGSYTPRVPPVRDTDTATEPSRIVSDGWSRKTIIANSALILGVAVIFGIAVLGALTLAYAVSYAIIHHEWAYVYGIPSTLIAGFLICFITLTRLNRKRHPRQ